MQPDRFLDLEEEAHPPSHPVENMAQQEEEPGGVSGTFKNSVHYL